MADTHVDLASPRTHAEAAARAAAERAGVVVRPLDGLAEFEAASDLIGRIWNDEGEPKAPVNLLRALDHAGDFVAGAFRGTELVGISFGFFGLVDSELHLHSHITGVAPDFQGRSLGFALKQFQRSWALERGAHMIEWTADPLVRANLCFNLAKLGASIVGYHENFYGQLHDRLNGTSDSDRAVIRWDLTSPRSIKAADGTQDDDAQVDGQVVLQPDADGAPSAATGDGDVLLAWIPDDIVRVRAHHAHLADAWRLALREAIGPRLHDGFRAERITRDGWLVLTR
ncbi:MAG TPA: GNAT family N-acetyltransferase [Gaiellaceae bacterium]|nr:GNAT family N-acetyltransferase [Gaiellaceae bacterium]